MHRWVGRESMRQSRQDPGSSCPPPEDKDEGKAKAALTERLHYTFPETGNNTDLLWWPALILKGQRPPPCSNIPYPSDLPTAKSRQ